MTLARTKFHNRFGSAEPITSTLADLNRLRQPFHAPEAATGDYVTHQRDDGTNGHWAVGFSAPVDEDAIRSDRRAQQHAALITATTWAAARSANAPGPDASVRLYRGALNPAHQIGRAHV